MYFLYADESGDVGIDGSPSTHFCLSGLVVHELRWHALLDATIEFRRFLKKRYGLKLRDEIHASAFIHHPGDVARIGKSMRLRILRDTLDFQATVPDISIVNVVVDKRDKSADTDVFEMAWTTLVQRFHNTLSHKNFPGPQNPDDRGILVVGSDRRNETATHDAPDEAVQPASKFHQRNCSPDSDRHNR